MAFIKVEVEEKPEYNVIIFTPRDDDEETRKQLELITHAVLTSQPKRGGMDMQTGNLRIAVKKEDLSEEL